MLWLASMEEHVMYLWFCMEGLTHALTMHFFPPLLCSYVHLVVTSYALTGKYHIKTFVTSIIGIVAFTMTFSDHLCFFVTWVIYYSLFYI
jgi:hypothetical protein